MNQKLLIGEKKRVEFDNVHLSKEAFVFNPFRHNHGMTLVEVLVAAAIGAISLGIMMTAAVRMVEIGKWQLAYETATSYGEQALEFAMYVPYANLTNTTPTATSISWVSNSQLYSTATATNLISTTRNGVPFVLTNVTHLATQSQLPLDDLGSYVVSRTVTVTDRSAMEPSSANLNYKLITVSNQWIFRGRTMPPIILSVIRDQP